MTSMVSRDDVEAAAWGIARPAVDVGVMRKFLRVIDSYAYAQARLINANAAETPAIHLTADPYAHVKPGKFDLDAGVGRCLKCEEVKSVSKFNKDNTSPWGRRVRCRQCIVEHARSLPPLKRKCTNCGRWRNQHTDFYASGKNEHDGFMLMCKDCKDGNQVCLICGRREPRGVFPHSPDHRDICRDCRRGRRPEVVALLSMYKCRVCGDRKYLDEFPDGKKTDPRGNYSCLACDGKASPPKTIKYGYYLCMECKDRKKLFDFPVAKRDNPAKHISCLKCQAPA